MDKRVIFAVAGSGKTTHIINRLNTHQRAIILTYTENNYYHLKNKIIQKFGYIPDNIYIQTYFNFLYSFCYKPFFHDTWRSKGINWDIPPAFTLRLKRTNKEFYMDQYSRLYSNRIAKLISMYQGVIDIIKRLTKYFDELYIDEIQDFASHDFNLIKEICSNVQINITLVGDFNQHTFDTSRDGSTNKNLHDDFYEYQQHFRDTGITVDTTTLARSYRCPPSVCNFIRTNLGINIESNGGINCSVELLTDEEKINQVFYDNSIVKLFYKEHSKYACFSNNWGKSKGLDCYSDVCVVLNKTTFQAYDDNKLSTIATSSRNKLYVACTRAKKNLYFINESKIKNFKIK